MAFQRLLEQEDAISKAERKSTPPKVPVNEDYLFDVDVENRELAPAYWLGPVYEVRRGIWFYQDGSVQRPCDESLAAQLEEGYLKVTAWRLPSAQTVSGPFRLYFRRLPSHKRVMLRATPKTRYRALRVTTPDHSHG